MAKFAALLRGINVGRNNRIAMADLRAMLTGLGYTDVKTLLQSGNAVFDVPGKGVARPEQLAATIEQQITEKFGLTISCVVITRADLQRIVDAYPLAEIATDPARMLVTFLSGPLDRAAFAGTDPAAFAPEVFELGEREIYLWMPEGVQNSKFPTAFWNKRLPGLVATARNWNTVLKLLAMMD